jgi:23S rRNA (uracil1939-C5)-methyltransferase
VSAVGYEAVRIDDVGREGDGIARILGETVFVPFTLKGDEVEIDRDGNRGTLITVLKPGPDRVVPPCPYFGQCGGCALQHMSGDSTRAYKHKLVTEALDIAGISVEVAPVIEAFGAGRRRATLHVAKGAAGYMQARSHDVLDIDACPILVPALRTAAPRIARALYAVAGECTASFTATDTGLDLAVKSGRKLKPTLLADFARLHQVARLTFNGEAIYMARTPVMKMGRAMVEPPPASFLQATAVAEDALARLVLEGLGPVKSVVDLFSGMGPFALRLAEGARVLAVDNDRPATDALLKAMRHVQGLKPITVLVRDLFRDPLAPVELEKFEAAVFDPPRAGAEAQALEMARSSLKTIVAVSCEPKSFARDAAILLAGGYRLESVTPVDQFQFSAHVELVAVFRK